MANIWYSVLGDGMGHAIRSDTVISGLIKKHSLMITATKKAYSFLKAKYGDIVHEIEGQEFVYENNTVNIMDSVKNYFHDLPFKFSSNIKQIPELLDKFRPDLVISDFEPAAHYFANILKIPCISIDNVHVLSECEIKMPTGSRLELLRAHVLVRFLHLKSDYYILTAFADARPKKPEKVTIISPIVRETIRKLKPEDKKHVLIYQTTPTNSKMISLLQKNDNQFIIYGMGNKRRKKNIDFKAFSEKNFLEDLRTCKYVILNGGFTLISEALYLKKPILAIPIENQLEQEFNGFSLQDKGYGDYTLSLNSQILDKFEHLIPFFRKNLAKQKKWDPNEVFKVLDKKIPELMKKKKPKYDLLKLMSPLRRI